MSAANGSSLLTVEGLTLGVRGRTLVRDIGFSLSPGETLCLVGESGSGKSLTANAVMGLLPPGIERQRGTIRFGGRDITAMDEEGLRTLRGREVGMIFQEPLSALNPVMRVRDQIREAFEVHGTPASAADITELLRHVGFRDPERIAPSYPHRLSGGQRQRVMIAMAIALKPRLIIADEPTTALDVTTQAQILDLLRSIRDEHGAAMLFITHDFGVVSEIADKVLVMRSGEVVEAAPVRELLERPRSEYTRQLLAAVPSGRARQRRELLSETVVRCEGLAKTYRVGGGFLKPRSIFRALTGIDLAVSRGETLGIIGESGSGKSTLAKALVGLVQPEAGRMTIEGHDALASRAARKALHRKVQMVFQDPFSSLNPRRRVLDILIEAPLAAGVSAGEARREAQEMLSLVGLPADAARRFPHEFSGGQRQRIAIARALAVKPSVLVADEPVSALDVSVQRQILDLLRDIGARLELTTIFITHDLRVAAELCDRLAIMREGAIVEYGWTSEVLAAPRNAYTRTLLASLPGLDPAVARGGTPR